jgi:hypothetical protein
LLVLALAILAVQIRDPSKAIQNLASWFVLDRVSQKSTPSLAAQSGPPGRVEKLPSVVRSAAFQSETLPPPGG